MASFDAKRYTTNDWGVIGGGALVLISSFLPWYGASSKFFSASVSGWSAGFTAWFSILLCIAAAAFVLARVAGVNMPTMPMGPALLVLGLSGLALVLMVIRFLTLPKGGGGILGSGFSYGPRIGIFLALIGALVQVAAAVLSFRSSGERMPSRGASPSAPPTA